MMCGAGTDANVILLRYGVLLREYALLALIVKLHGTAKVSAISVFRPNVIQTVFKWFLLLGAQAHGLALLQRHIVKDVHLKGAAQTLVLLLHKDGEAIAASLS